MSKENSHREIPAGTLEVRFYRSTEPGNKITHKAMVLPTGLSSGAIKEVLSQMVWGFNPGRGVAFLPRDSETGDTEIITSEDLVDLRSLPKEDRLSQLDIDSMRIKNSDAAVIIERIVS